MRRAIEEAWNAANADPGSAEKALRLGMTLQAHSQFQAASQCYARAHALDRKRFDTLYYWGQSLAANGDYAQASDRLKKALALRPESTPAQLKLAEVLRDSGDLTGSAGLCRKALQRDAYNAAAHYGLGRTLNGQDAIAEYRKALELFPRYGAAQFALASEYRKAGNTGLAEQTLVNYDRDKTLIPPGDDPETAALRELDVSATGLLRRAGQEEAAGRLDEALAMHQRAVAMEPGLVDAWVNLISLNARLHRDEEAVQAYRKAITLAPQRADAYYNYGVFCTERDRAAEAMAAFQKVVEIDPRHAEALHNLGALVEREGKWDEAARLYLRCLAVRPSYPLARFHLGRIYANQKKYTQAIAEFEKSLDPPGESTPAYLYALAATHARAGNRERAGELMEQARTQASARGQSALVASIDRDLAALGRRR